MLGVWILALNRSDSHIHSAVRSTIMLKDYSSTNNFKVLENGLILVQTCRRHYLDREWGVS
jgi:hypothetical protein